MRREPKGPVADRSRERKFERVGLCPIRLDLLPGSLSRSRTRCGKPTCQCADGEGHEAWTLTFMSGGKRRVERIPKPWVDQVRQQVEAGRNFQEAVREALTANAELLILARKQESLHRRSPCPRHVRC